MDTSHEVEVHCLKILISLSVTCILTINYNLKESREFTIEKKSLKITIIIITRDKMDIISY